MICYNISKIRAGLCSVLLQPIQEDTVKRKPINLHWCAGLLLLASTQGAAETAGDSAQRIEEITVTAHRSETTLKEIPASVALITEEEIRRLQPNTLGDLFRYEPGVLVENSGGRHGDANINVRGIGGNRVLIVKDGVRMPDGFGSAGTDQGRGNFSAYNLDRVEVLKGAASALYGSDALGGVVLLNSLDAEKAVKRNDGEPLYRIDTGYFDVDDRYRAAFMTASELAGGYGMVQFERHEFSEVESNGRFTPNPKDGELQSVLAKWSYRVSDNQKWLLLGNYWQQNVDNRLDTNIGPISGPPGAAITEAAAEDDSRRWHVGVQHSVKDLAGLDSLKWQLDYQTSNYEQDELERQSSLFTSNLILEHEEFEQEQISANIQLDHQWGKHAVTLGSDLVRRDLSRPVDRQDFDLINGTVSRTNAGLTYPGKTYPDTDIEQYGVYLQDVYSPIEQLRLMIGVRYDYYSSSPNVDEAYSNFNIQNAPVDDRSDSEVSPHIGVTYFVNEQMEFYGNYNTGFRAPPVDDQFISRAILIPVPGVPHEVVPNNDLKPETSKGFELGWRWQNEFISVNLAYYDNRYEDFIDSQTIGFRNQPPIFVGPTAIRQIQFQNLDEVTIDGWEMGVRVSLGEWLPGGWQGDVRAAFNVIDGENEETGTGLNSVGPNTAVLGVHFSNPRDTLGFGWHMRAAERADDAEPLNFRGTLLPSFEPPGYAVHDFDFFWRPLHGLQLDVSVFNAFDKRYWPAYEKGSNADGDLEATLAPGRSLALSLSYQL